MIPIVGHLPNGIRGFDANTRITAPLAKAMHDHGYRFAVRYVRRVQPHSFDLTAAEIVTLLNAGLGVMVVQHVANDGWVPTAMNGSNYGLIAAAETKAIGVPPQVHLWCDLEGVRPGVPAQDVIAFCNAWHDEVEASGYRPGLYVGWHPGLTGQQLYRDLRFKSYWGAYNIDRASMPAPRGLMMRQYEVCAADQVPGIHLDFDVNVIHADAMGDTPSLLLPSFGA